jgi:adenine phosphoribosyltransferase
MKIKWSLRLILCFLLISQASYAGFERDYIKTHVQYFPHKGVKYYNLTEMFKDIPLNDYIIETLAGEIEKVKPNYLASPEARSLPVFGGLIYKLKLPGIFIRKAGKLPDSAPKLRASYNTAYSVDSIEMTQDENLEGKKVVIVDDGIASGGTTLATIHLLEQAGMKVVGIYAVVGHHYTSRLEAYLPWESITFTLFDL